MMQIAFSRDPRFALGVCSHGRFLDKIQALDRLGLSGRWWTFLIGLDTFARILEPRFYTDPAKELAWLFQRANFVVFSRPVVSPKLQHKLREWIEGGASIAWMALPEHIQEISSTRVRQGRAMGRPLCEWVHPGVETFIEDTGLYLPSPPHPPLYEARKRLLEHLFKEGPGPFSERDLRQEALAICRAAS